MEETKENVKSEIVKVEQSIEETKKELSRLIQEALPGKCSIRFFEINSEKIDWEHPILREPYKSWKVALQHLTATTDSAIAEEIFIKGLNALPGKNAARKANIAVQSLADSTPHDAIEARLCMQETTLYSQGMEYLSRADKTDNILHAEFYMKNAIKLLRLHNETIETHSKYHRGGEQRVVVQHVQVNDGGKAIVGGNLAMNGGGENKK